ncbi:hypothetical protein [Corynebacterium doosanense]|uniref:Uncharacterized protein n=1 Tax=Corynebacterium doosanense CAU 212 = DSM 45436 TaxID=558173 RepID=A0A097IJ81_9CORY|nr:hypothetical protein [Corynebacterium doosanense]AIT62180.1 hypothetical protein CDOO_01920 [Corynebacterium doosanense CAU 212 = DSM 45436]
MTAETPRDGSLEAAFLRSIEAHGDYGKEWDGLTVLGRLVARNIDEAGTVDSSEQRKALNLSHYFLNVWDRLGLPSNNVEDTDRAGDPARGVPQDPEFRDARVGVMQMMKSLKKDGA